MSSNHKSGEFSCKEYSHEEFPMVFSHQNVNSSTCNTKFCQKSNTDSKMEFISGFKKLTEENDKLNNKLKTVELKVDQLECLLAAANDEIEDKDRCILELYELLSQKRNIE